MWVEHFLLPTEISAVNAKRLGRLTYTDLAVLISAKTRSVEANIKRKLQKIEAKEKKDMEQEAEIFKMFM